LARDSTLPLDERQEWFNDLLQAARRIPDPTDRAAVLSGLGMALANLDPESSLRIHWEALTIVRQLGLKPEGWHDVSDELGTVFKLANADEVLQSSFSRFTGDVSQLTSILWRFARRLEAGEDRDALLEAISMAFVKERDFGRAAGVVSLVAGRARQSRLWSALAEAQFGGDNAN
jgi:hypothetical protein